MPYIEKNRRIDMDKVVALMNDFDIKANGDLNYVLYAFCLRHVKPSYNNYKNFCGELRQCATEIERRLLAAHEEKKKDENGDID